MTTIRDSSGISFEAPSPVRLEADSRGIDSAVSAWTANGYEVTIDRGPFADPLTQYGAHREYVTLRESVSGRDVRIVEFVDSDGSMVAGAHFPHRLDGGTGEDADPITVIVRLDPGSSRDVALSIIRSIRFPVAGNERGE